jgi:hypothetical protein
MTWRTDLQALVNTFDDITAARTETVTIANPYTYKLASTAAAGGASAIPAAWQAIPHGAPAAPAPAVIPTFTDKTTTRGLLAHGTTGYTYGLTYRTNYGETKALNTALHNPAGSNNAVEIVLPSYPNSTYNPITGVMIYRSKIDTTTPLYPIGQITNPRIGGWLDEVGDNQMQSTTTAPANDTSGLNILGSPNLPVSVVGPLAAGGSGQWTEVPYGTTVATEHYSVDYLSDANGGNVYFSSADNGKVVTITYTAAVDITAPFINSITSPLRTMSAIGSFSRTHAVYAGGNTGTTWTQIFPQTISTQGGTRVELTCSFNVYLNGTAGGVILFDFVMDGYTIMGTYALGSNFPSLRLWEAFSDPRSGTKEMVSIKYTTDLMAAGNHTFGLGYCTFNATPNYDFENFSLESREVF